MLPARSGRSYVLRANRSRVDDGSVFSRIAVVGKHFPQKLFTFSHNSQNRNPFDTQLGLGSSEDTFAPGARQILQKIARVCPPPSPPAHVPSVLFLCAGWEKAGGKVARQQLKIDRDKFAPDKALNGRAKELARQTHPPGDC